MIDWAAILVAVNIVLASALIHMLVKTHRTLVQLRDMIARMREALHGHQRTFEYVGRDSADVRSLRSADPRQ